MARKKAVAGRQDRRNPESAAIVQAPLAQLQGSRGEEPPSGYLELLEALKTRIRASQLHAAVAVNRDLVLLYWSIGREILLRQRNEGWGARVIDRLSADLHREFPEMSGFSPRNLKYMRTLAEAYPDETFVQEVLAQITWHHNITLLSKVKESTQRRWYVDQTIRYGWSRNVLRHPNDQPRRIPRECRHS